jgi:hypothetical protein
MPDLTNDSRNIVRCCRGEYVPPVEGGRHVLRSSLNHSRIESRVLRQHLLEHAVIWPDEDPYVRLHRDRLPISSNSRIHYHNIDCIWWEGANRIRQNNRAMRNVKRLNLMSYIHNINRS